MFVLRRLIGCTVCYVPCEIVLTATAPSAYHRSDDATALARYKYDGVSSDKQILRKDDVHITLSTIMSCK